MGDISTYFDRAEFACKCGCGFDTVDIDLLPICEDVREHFGKPVIITSGCRCPEHNRNEGGAKDSFHVKGRAADIVVSDVPAPQVYAYLAVRFPGQLGLGRYSGWTHIDTRTDGGARW